VLVLATTTGLWLLSSSTVITDGAEVGEVVEQRLGVVVVVVVVVVMMASMDRGEGWWVWVWVLSCLGLLAGEDAAAAMLTGLGSVSVFGCGDSFDALGCCCWAVEKGGVLL
jgi:hypothetical protein